jgi:hypothetical protein
MEYAYRIMQNKNEEVTFAVQQLIDCDQYSNGCAGGYTENALLYLEDNFPVSTVDYPYRVNDLSACKDK